MRDTKRQYGDYPEKEPPANPDQKAILVDGLYYTEEAVRKMVKVIEEDASIWHRWHFPSLKAVPVLGKHSFTSNYDFILGEGAEVIAFDAASMSQPDWEKAKGKVRVCIDFNGKLQPIDGYKISTTLEQALKEWKDVEYWRYNGPDESQCCC
jgi:hypothetical protein